MPNTKNKVGEKKCFLRLIIFIALLTFSVLSFGQGNQKLKGKPTTLEETYHHLDRMFDDNSKYSFMTLPEEFAAGRLHHSLGMWIRNNWELWRNSKLKRYFLGKGFDHPDIMSSCILNSYHRYLNKTFVRDNNTTAQPKEIFIDKRLVCK